MDTEMPLRQVSPSATSRITNSTWIGMGLNLGLRYERPVTNRFCVGVPSRRQVIFVKIMKVCVPMLFL